MVAPLVCILALGLSPWPGGGAPPGRPELFAPGLVGSGMPTRDLAVDRNGDFYFSVFQHGFHHASIQVARRTRDGWAAPETAPFVRDPRWRTLEPCISPDGSRFYFASDRPEGGGEVPGRFGIWVMARTASGWGEPRRLPAPVNGPEPAFFPSVTAGGALYFTRDGADGRSSIWRAAPRGDGFAEPERLPAQINAGSNRFNACVAADESCLIVPIIGRADSQGGVDYYVTFRNAAGAWSEPMNLGAPINSPDADEYSPCLSPGGEAFIFMSGRVRPDRFGPGEPVSFAKLRRLHDEPGGNGNPALWWVKVDFLAELRKKAVFN